MPAFIGMALLVALGIGGLTLALYLVLAVFFFVVAAGVAALSSFGDRGMGALAIGAMPETDSLVRDLRGISARLDSNPAGYVLGRQRLKEFEPK